MPPSTVSCPCWKRALSIGWLFPLLVLTHRTSAQLRHPVDGCSDMFQRTSAASEAAMTHIYPFDPNEGSPLPTELCCQRAHRVTSSHVVRRRSMVAAG
uniref:Putative secreted peptide n=1 Tax=Anopheles braziliensis TaxID=58242 RepID=A0A2M3ZQ62_9DIPT